MWIGAIICTAAGGYAINDWRDVATDSINKPWRPLPAKKMTTAKAKKIAILLFTLAFFCAVFLLQQLFLWLTCFSIVLLVAYAFRLKCMPLVGNLSVAGLSAAPFASFALLCNRVHVGWYELAVFSFLTHFLREQIKCLQDIQADRSTNCHTLPVIIGSVWAHRVAMLTMVVLLAACAIMVWIKPHEFMPAWLLLCVLMSIFAWRLQVAQTANDFALLARLLKWLMVAGMAVVWWSAAKQ